MLSCGIETRLQILSPHKKSIGWAVGAEVTSRRYYGRRKPIERGQDGRVVKASFFCEMLMVTRGIETRLQILSSKEVHMVRRDGFNHVRDSIWRRHLPIF